MGKDVGSMLSLSCHLEIIETSVEVPFPGRTSSYDGIRNFRTRKHGQSAGLISLGWCLWEGGAATTTGGRDRKEHSRRVLDVVVVGGGADDNAVQMVVPQIPVNVWCSLSWVRQDHRAESSDSHRRLITLMEILYTSVLCRLASVTDHGRIEQ